jgi:hypothetical protein
VGFRAAGGPGRVDTFNSAKVIFNFPMHRLDPKEFDAPADFPSIWLQRRAANRGRWSCTGTATTPT